VSLNDRKRLVSSFLLQFIAEAGKKPERNLGFRTAKSGSERLEPLIQKL
jgi:hypothetical protein